MVATDKHAEGDDERKMKMEDLLTHTVTLTLKKWLIR